MVIRQLTACCARRKHAFQSTLTVI